MTTIIDVSSDCGSKAPALAAAGVKTVIRYYSRDTIRPSKRLSPGEAAKLTNAGLRIGIVHEGRFGNKPENFDRDSGAADGKYAFTNAASTIHQPNGSAIYFAVDFDATPTQIRDRVIPYFQGVAQAAAIGAGRPSYLIGVYGSGSTCKAVLDAGLAHYTWLAQARGWAGYTAFLNSERWALSQGMPISVAGVDCDPNESAQSEDFGDFVLSGQTVEAVAPAAFRPAPMAVNARSGLRLRAGPGTEFDTNRLLPLGFVVYPIKSVGAWTMIDLEGDGVGDGFVSSAYLSDPKAATGPSAMVGTAASEAMADAAHLTQLINQGTSAEGLKAARLRAAASLPGYPTNGCAAHLSALLQLSGIDVKMTWGAGKLASILSDRGWARVNVGGQQAGDVGVCFDNDPTPAGADHIYLVVGTSGTDQMMIADNQRKADAPHLRYASGKGGKTPTEYFLRAT